MKKTDYEKNNFIIIFPKTRKTKHCLSMFRPEQKTLLTLTEHQWLNTSGFRSASFRTHSPRQMCCNQNEQCVGGTRRRQRRKLSDKPFSHPLFPSGADDPRHFQASIFKEDVVSLERLCSFSAAALSLQKLSPWTVCLRAAQHWLWGQIKVCGRRPGSHTNSRYRPERPGHNLPKLSLLKAVP